MKHDNISESYENIAQPLQFFWSLNQKINTRKHNIAENIPSATQKKLSAGNKLTEKEAQSLISGMTNPKDVLELNLSMEEHFSEADLENLWIAGLELFSNSIPYLENIGFYFFRKNSFHKSLNYLTKAHSLGHSFFSLSLAIASAYAVAQYHLVWDYYNNMSAADRKKLDESLLSKVATSALHQKMYEQAQKIFEMIQIKHKAEPLPSLEQSLKERFGSESKMKSWTRDISGKISDKKSRSEISLGDCITYAASLIHMEKYEDALNCMLQVKTERFS